LVGQVSQFAGSAVINRPIEAVWSFISDPQNTPVWGRGVSDIVITSNGPVGLGTTLSLRMSGSKMEARMVRYEAGKTLTLEFTSGPVRGSKLTYSVESAEGKTRLTTDLEMRLSGVWKLMYPILTRRRIKDRELSVTNVKRILEAQTSAGV
jgi:carbon monoxide dehydrogenase subunit G